ncbi:MAG: acetyl-CoA carboxylase biotin carboxyl carrier protein [Opitutae bacterium]|nr:acetyl-CoA carboxylase biotin carboxyl carrier protein [Opitutae bacterium]
MDLKQIKQIIELIKRSELTEFEFEEDGFKIKVKRGAGGQPVIMAPASLSAHPFPIAPVPAPTPAAPVSAPVANPAGDETGFAFVKSPMVGTFYKSASPESPAFVNVGAKVEEKSVVCIIEAMKIMNEIQAETKGTVVEILVENGQPVEYGQRLFKVKLA